MKRLISCAYHEDSQTVELRYADWTLIDIDCLAVEDEVARHIYEPSELDYLLYHDPVGYAELILSGDVVEYLRNVTDFRPLDERILKMGRGAVFDTASRSLSASKDRTGKSVCFRWIEGYQ